MRPLPHVFSASRCSASYLPASLALLLAACGGGGGSGGLPTGGALVKGNVVAVNGQSTNVSGVTVRAASTGALDVSDTGGTFDLGTLPVGRQVIQVKTSRGDDQEVEIEIEDGGVVRVRLSVDDDGIARVSEERCDDDGGRAETRARLTAVEVGLEGHVKVRKDADGDQGFDVEAEHLATGRLVDIVVIDPETGDEETLARLTAGTDDGDDGDDDSSDDGDEAELELRTSDGDRLPFNVSDVAELADVRVEVRDAVTGLAILEGDVPSIGSVPTCSGGSDDDSDDDSGDDDGDDDSGDDDDSIDDSDGDGDDDSSDDRGGEARLANQNVVTGTAHVELRSRPSRGEEKIEVEVNDSNAVGTLEVWLEDPANLGTLVMVGTLSSSDDDELEFERDTSDGETLPFGVLNAADLVGLAVEVRRASDGAVLFAGTTPPLRID